MDKRVLIYINKHQEQCQKLVNQLNQWQVTFEIKDVSQKREYMKELQDQGIYGTPVTFVDGKPILGFQLHNLKYMLGIIGNGGMYFNS